VLGLGDRSIGCARSSAPTRELFNCLASAASRWATSANETERLLRERVQELGGRVEHGVELVRLVEQGDVVDVTLRDATGRKSELGVDYVVGCDGAHSRVRHELGLAFEGQPYTHEWLLADVALDGADPDDETHIFFRPDGRSLVCIPMGH
jgi:2-polyprenyl-6-methoxyphenol hydroxylase-like FAD-dependent oxidoreductase